MSKRDREKGNTKFVVIVVLAVALLGLIGFIVFQNVKQKGDTAVFTSSSTFGIAGATKSQWSIQDTLSYESGNYALNDQAYTSLFSATLASTEVAAGCTESPQDITFNFVYGNVVSALSAASSYSIIAPIIVAFESTYTQLPANECVDPSSLPATLSIISDSQNSIQSDITTALNLATSL